MHGITVMPLLILHHQFEPWHVGPHIQDLSWVVQKHYFLPVLLFCLQESKSVPCHGGWAVSRYLIQPVHYDFTYPMQILLWYLLLW